MADPSDLFAYDELARILKREISLAVVTETQLMATIDRVYTPPRCARTCASLRRGKRWPGC